MPARFPPCASKQPRSRSRRQICWRGTAPRIRRSLTSEPNNAISIGLSRRRCGDWLPASRMSTNWPNPVASFEQSLQQATGQVNVDDTTAIRLRELERAVTVNKSLFEDFLQRAKITQEQSTFEAREARIITRALPPGSPSYPNKTKYMSAFVIIGLLVGVGGALAKEMLNAG